MHNDSLSSEISQMCHQVGCMPVDCTGFGGWYILNAMRAVWIWRSSRQGESKFRNSRRCTFGYRSCVWHLAWGPGACRTRSLKPINHWYKLSSFLTWQPLFSRTSIWMDIVFYFNLHFHRVSSLSTFGIAHRRSTTLRRCWTYTSAVTVQTIFENNFQVNAVGTLNWYSIKSSLSFGKSNSDM